MVRESWPETDVHRRCRFGSCSSKLVHLCFSSVLCTCVSAVICQFLPLQYDTYPYDRNDCFMCFETQRAGTKARMTVILNETYLKVRVWWLVWWSFIITIRIGKLADNDTRSRHNLTTSGNARGCHHRASPYSRRLHVRRRWHAFSGGESHTNCRGEMRWAGTRDKFHSRINWEVFRLPGMVKTGHYTHRMYF